MTQDNYTQLSIDDSRPPRKTRRARLRGPLPDGCSWCSRCQQVKPVGLFYPDPARPRGVVAYCIDCQSSVRSEKYYSSPSFRRGVASDALRRKVGITIDQRDEMLTKQDGKCGICGKAFKSTRDTHVDHNHATGVVRGLLCMRCNTNISVLDDPEWRSQAELYLERHGK